MQRNYQWFRTQTPDVKQNFQSTPKLFTSSFRKPDLESMNSPHTSFESAKVSTKSMNSNSRDFYKSIELEFQRLDPNTRVASDVDILKSLTKHIDSLVIQKHFCFTCGIRNETIDSLKQDLRSQQNELQKELEKIAEVKMQMKRYEAVVKQREGELESDRAHLEREKAVIDMNFREIEKVKRRIEREKTEVEAEKVKVKEEKMRVNQKMRVIDLKYLEMNRKIIGRSFGKVDEGYKEKEFRTVEENLRNERNEILVKNEILDALAVDLGKKDADQQRMENNLKEMMSGLKQLRVELERKKEELDEMLSVKMKGLEKVENRVKSVKARMKTKLAQVEIACDNVKKVFGEDDKRNEAIKEDKVREINWENKERELVELENKLKVREKNLDSKENGTDQKGRVGKIDDEAILAMENLLLCKTKEVNELKQEIKNKEGALKKIEQDLNSKAEGLKEIERNIENQQQKLKEQEENLIKREFALSEKNTKITEKEENFINKANELYAKENELLSNEAKIASKDTAIVNKEQALILREQNLISAEGLVKFRESGLSEKEKFLKTQQDSLLTKESSLKSFEHSIQQKSFELKSLEEKIISEKQSLEALKNLLNSKQIEDIDYVSSPVYSQGYKDAFDYYETHKESAPSEPFDVLSSSSPSNALKIQIKTQNSSMSDIILPEAKEKFAEHLDIPDANEDFHPNFEDLLSELNYYKTECEELQLILKSKESEYEEAAIVLEMNRDLNEKIRDNEAKEIELLEMQKTLLAEKREIQQTAEMMKEIFMELEVQRNSLTLEREIIQEEKLSNEHFFMQESKALEVKENEFKQKVIENAFKKPLRKKS